MAREKGKSREKRTRSEKDGEGIRGKGIKELR